MSQQQAAMTNSALPPGFKFVAVENVAPKNALSLSSKQRTSPAAARPTQMFAGSSQLGSAGSPKTHLVNQALNFNAVSPATNSDNNSPSMHVSPCTVSVAGEGTLELLGEDPNMVSEVGLDETKEEASTGVVGDIVTTITTPLKNSITTPLKYLSSFFGSIYNGTPKKQDALAFD